jgi:methylthioribose-1-phosphate isomerase
MSKKLRAFVFEEDRLRLLDQRKLPVEEKWIDLYDVEGIAKAIESLAVRGAPAIGGAAACAIAIAAREDMHSVEALGAELKEADARLRKTRPTAVNLFWALDRMAKKRDELVAADAAIGVARDELEKEARAILTEDEKMCADMGEHGAALFEDGDKVLTVCHTGALATCGQGTALGVLKSAVAAGKKIEVYAMETRPLLQGARLTAWECLQEGLDVTVITDGMVGFAFQRLGITKAISGADRIARNGDTANKIGTYTLASMCRAHDVPFYVAAPTTTLDTSLASGADIPIEERDADEVRKPRGAQFSPADVKVWNPAFDVTPAALIEGVISERGVWSPSDGDCPWE